MRDALYPHEKKSKLIVKQPWARITSLVVTSWLVLVDRLQLCHSKILILL